MDIFTYMSFCLFILTFFLFMIFMQLRLVVGSLKSIRLNIEAIILEKENAKILEMEKKDKP